VAPSVVVRDASGAALSGIAVTFAVDSGGGSITGASAVTGSNGIAAVGSWTLGAATGRNILLVTVAGLAPLRIAATATAGASTYPSVAIGTGGGAVTIHDTGPLNGFALTLPAGAFAAATQWTISYSPSTAVPRTSGVNPLTPLIQISSSVGSRANTVLTLSIPVTVPAGTTPFIVLRDPTSGSMEVLTTHFDGTVATANTNHLNGDRLIDTLALAAGLRRASLRSGYDIQVFITGMTTEQLAVDFDTGFRPGTDDWEFESMGTEQAPDGICAGITVSEAWYYFTQRQGTGRHLFNRFTAANGVAVSDTTGIHWASLVQSRYEANNEAGMNDYLNRFEQQGNTGSVQQDLYNSMKANMIVTHLPVFVALAGAVVNNQGIWDHSALAWKTAGTQTFLADAAFPGNQTTSVGFSLGKFLPYTQPDHLGDAGRSYPQIYPVPMSQVISTDGLASDWPSVLDHSINTGAFPNYQLRTKYGPVSDTVWFADTLRIWAECGHCTPVLSSPLVPEATASLTAQKQFEYLPASNTWSTTLLDGQFALGYAGNLINAASNSVGGFYAVGINLQGSNGFVGTDQEPDYLWLSWHNIRQIKLGALMTTTVANPTIGSPFTITLALTGTQPSHIDYRWTFGDGSDTVIVHDVGNVQHTFNVTGPVTVKVEALYPATQQPMVSATGQFTVMPPSFNWKITSATLVSTSGPPGGIVTAGDASWQQFAQAIIAGLPQTGSIHDSTDAASGCSGLVLIEPTPTNYPGLPDTKGVLAGNCPAITLGTGTLSIGSFGSGTVIGTAMGAGVNAGVGGSINATMHGTTLTGTFVWNLPTFSTGVAAYTVSFTAEEIPPP
jgi:hypothetical protein